MDKGSITDITEEEDIILDNISFFYGSETQEPTLKDVSLTVESGKVTAIVGVSGCGKTTLLKLLLKFYEPNKGNIFLGGYNLNSLNHNAWRERCGVVMQDGTLLSGTITDNIALGRSVNTAKVIDAAKIAQIDSFINDLPMGYLTEMGQSGVQVSSGQKQRILLARAIYKNPSYLFLDEATSALDSKNELQIINNLNDFFESRTVIVIAHRLSTVRKADKIVIIDKGEIIETGNHEELINKKGAYFNLVKNQLEIGGQ